MNLKEVKQYIKDEGLDVKTNKWDIVHPRFFLCYWLRQNTTLNYSDIAEIVGYKGHDRVIHAIKKHNDFTSIKDIVYLNNIKNVKSFLNDGEVLTYNLSDLKEEILRIDSLIDLHILQKQIKESDYIRKD